MHAAVHSPFVAAGDLAVADLLLDLAEESAGLAAELAGPGSAANAVVDYLVSARWDLPLVIAVALVVQQHWQPGFEDWEEQLGWGCSAAS